MIGKIPDKRKDGKSSFRELVSYCKDAPAQAAHVGFQHLLSPETAAIENRRPISGRCGKNT